MEQRIATAEQRIEKSEERMDKSEERMDKVEDKVSFIQGLARHVSLKVNVLSGFLLVSRSPPSSLSL